MAFFPYKFRLSGRSLRKLNFSRKDVIFYGVLAVFVLILSLTMWDGFVFYQTLFEERGEVQVVSSFEKISSEDIDEVVRILDEREKKFKEILGK